VQTAGQMRSGRTDSSARAACFAASAAAATAVAGEGGQGEQGRGGGGGGECGGGGAPRPAPPVASHRRHRRRACRRANSRRCGRCGLVGVAAAGAAIFLILLRVDNRKAHWRGSRVCGLYRSYLLCTGVQDSLMVLCCCHQSTGHDLAGVRSWDAAPLKMQPKVWCKHAGGSAAPARAYRGSAAPVMVISVNFSSLVVHAARLVYV
jgi:hypothetical protein